MISSINLTPGDLVVYNHPKTDEFDVGLFVKITKWKTPDKGIDMVVLNSLGSKTSINEQNVDWECTAFFNENGASS